MSSDRPNRHQEMIERAYDERGRMSPSRFMRELRPEYYSDTRDRVAYDLDAPLLEYHLDTITSRNQTHEFEVFCRKLCERTICPNLRAQSGPDGGGDSKADSETFSVADEIATLTYVGEPNAGRERWAFAFSAKEAWKVKVRADVAGIVATGRNYDRIIFVTSRFAKSKERSRIEDELTESHGVPVTIDDRSWIVAQIIEQDHKDIAFNYLHVGTEKSDPLRLGPTDYSRLQQLTDSEQLLSDPASFAGMESQLVTEALLCAKLSRGLEGPRIETEGRFMRAIRLADSHGSYHQKLETQYELIWTGFWWWDDVALLNAAYSSFEAMSLKADHAKHLEFLCTLNQLLVNCVVHRLLTREDAKLDERMETLHGLLAPMAANVERPNNRLEAMTSLLIIRLNRVLLGGDRTQLAGIWTDYASILDDAGGLGEFDFERLKATIELSGDIAGNDAGYNALVERLADFVSERTSASEGARILLARAQKLDFEDHYEMIRLLGRAVIGLTKKEHSDILIEALHLLAVAYRSAGLLWAARSTCIFAAATIAIEGETDGQVPALFVPTMKLWAWLSVELCHLPDFLEAIQLMRGCYLSLPLDDTSKRQVQEDLRELDMALGSVLLNQNASTLARLGVMPDILAGLELFTARTALLYRMGHEKTLREDGSLPAAEKDGDVHRFLSILASQPVSQFPRYDIALNAPDPQTLSASIAGMAVSVSCDGTEEYLMVAEVLLGSLEAFLATLPQAHAAPHTERFSIDIVEAYERAPRFEVDPLRPLAKLSWPRAMSPANFSQSEVVGGSMVEVCGVTLAATCMTDGMEGLLNRLFEDEGVQQRLAIVRAGTTSYHRLTGRNLTRLEHWNKVIRRSYDLIEPLPVMDRIDLPDRRDKQGNSDSAFDPTVGPNIKDHRSVGIKSVIDLHAWNKATWRGAAYASFGNEAPPVMALMFEDEEAARVIFERWRERFGETDEAEAIRISIVRNLPGQKPSYYCVVIGARQNKRELNDGRLQLVTNRSLTMEPDDTVNLDRFLRHLARTRVYVLIPAILSAGKEPRLLPELAITKAELIIRNAADIGEHDMDSVALRRRA